MEAMSPSLASSRQDEVEISYVEFPSDNPPLLLLHGFARNWRDWEPLLSQLVIDWHVFAIDHRGHGASGRSASYLVNDYASDAKRFVLQTFARPVVVVGHSLGAMVSLALAAEGSQLIDRVILEDPPFHTMGQQITATPYFAQFSGMKAVAQIGGATEEMTDALGEIRIPTSRGQVRLSELRDRASLRFSAECLATVDPEVFTPLIEGRWLDGFDYETHWLKVKCPVLLLQGDPETGGALADSDVNNAKALLPDLKHMRFDSVGHQIHRSVPNAVFQAIKAFSTVH